jgi:diaminopimelate epimerase
MFVVKAHAYGNDFLLVAESDVGARDRAAVARAGCARQTGIGADGLIVYGRRSGGAVMSLYNADGSRAELSGNGLRALAAWLVETRNAGESTGPGAEDVQIETDAGEKRLTLVKREGSRYTFRAAMGPPEAIAERELEAAGEHVRVVTLRVGNPQCVVVGEVSEARLGRLGPALATHPAFPEGTNVELAAVEAPDRVRILIWERGVGPTRASGTGACAAAVAAALVGGAGRDVVVEAPGGAQRVEWRRDGLYLTGWAEIVLTGDWRLPAALE